MLAGLGLQPAPARAEAPAVKVLLDGLPVAFEEQPILEDGTTLVAFRPIFERLGLTVSWDPQTKTVSGVRTGLKIVLTIDQAKAYVNGQAVTLEKAPRLVNGNTLVPLRFVGEASGATVSWDGETSTVLIAPMPVERTVEEIARQVDKVVYLETMDEKGKAVGAGSGFLLTPDGRIVTNYHVVAGASSVRVTLADKREYTVDQVLYADEEKDLVVLKVKDIDLPVVQLGDSDQVKAGETVVAIGSPLGMTNTVSTGIISSASRQLEGQTYIQTTAPLDHGSSGGPLFNLKGEVIGITSGGLGSFANLNLAVPINELKNLMEQPAAPKPMPLEETRADWFDMLMELEDRLNDEFGGPVRYIADGHTFHMSFEVDQDEEEGTIYIDAVVRDRQEGADLIRLQQQSPNLIPDFFRKIGNEAHKDIPDNVQLMIWHSFRTTEFPSSYKPKQIEKDVDGSYIVTLPLYAGYLDFAEKKLYFMVDPSGRNSTEKELPL
ncbi:hypothetical protein J31TS4_32150 [Paenibacillus sp. J31TS4]|nr:hypothetical protein J31TS4_32150 [Paenibacillus sp. J31TS4]